MSESLAPLFSHFGAIIKVNKDHLNMDAAVFLQSILKRDDRTGPEQYKDGWDDISSQGLGESII